MEFGIVGLPFVGKTTLFNALTQAHAETGHYAAGQQANRAVVRVSDPRLERLAETFRPKQVTPTTITYVDTGGLVPGAFQRGTMTPQFLATLRTMDALVHVVRGFEDAAVPHEHGSVDPKRDLALLETELLLADLQVAESRLERLNRELRVKKDAELQRERETLERCRSALEAGRPLREVDLSPEEERLIRGFQFLTRKPMLIVLNVGEEEAAQEGALLERLGLEERPRVRALVLSAQVEMELAELPDEEALAFREDLGLPPESALERVIRESYALLDVITFFTVNEREARAWTIPRGATALEAAGTIHSDMARGFIRAEVIPWDELVQLGSYAHAREAGKLRLEGKEYPVQDGEVLLIRFNV
ncbi:MAG: ribosome-binding ATPase YchF [Candidatus Poribacteria bacterium]|nr:MAG: ribosome-binding ATPase YchF [Candidatus Poribacteria bacterium]